MLQTAEDIRLLNEKINHSASFIDKIHAEIGKVIVGQNHMVERLADRPVKQWTYIAGRGARPC